jgi:hypothetical protein
MIGTGACGGGKDEAADKACGPPPTAVTGGVVVPASFPVPTGVTLVSSTKNGPSTVLDGYTTQKLGDVFSSYKTELAKQPFSVTKSEKDAHDAEVNFESNETTGQVKLQEACKDRVSITITSRPK